MLAQWPRIIAHFEAAKRLDPETARALAERAAATGDSPARVLLESGTVSEAEYRDAMARLYGAEPVSLSDGAISEDAVKRVSARLAHRYRFMPVRLTDEGLTVAVSDPTDLKLQDDLERILKLRLRLCLADAGEIDAAIRHHYGVGAEIIEQIIDDRDLGGRVAAESGEADADLGDQTVEASIIKFVNQILLDAYRDQATDIHFDPFEACYRIRKRIDGVLYEVPVPASLRHFQHEIVSRIKIMAKSASPATLISGGKLSQSCCQRRRC